jgi:hypothetical protein
VVARWCLRGGSLCQDKIDFLQFLELLVQCIQVIQCTASIYLFYLSSLSSPLLAVAMAFTRSVTSILRTSRLAACSSRHVNPINRVFGHDRFAARTYATVFERTKPHVNIGKGKLSYSCQTNADSPKERSVTLITARYAPSSLSIYHP